MIDFGYNLNKDRQIDFDVNNRKIAQYVKKNEPTFSVCISCGTCTATCSAAQFTDFNFRKLMILINRGETLKLKNEISKCMLCGKCFLACPRNVNTRNIILNIKKAVDLL
ncbi:MAG: (4Fe-4S)-binding protein [Bacteroidetes bacterium GWA2_32_17]|nr:MAG: (4Fe-4S)-binding protein [Bacteroidetes bacterium GWA2_32_17]